MSACLVLTVIANGMLSLPCPLWSHAGFLGGSAYTMLGGHSMLTVGLLTLAVFNGPALAVLWALSSATSRQHWSTLPPPDIACKLLQLWGGVAVPCTLLGAGMAPRFLGGSLPLIVGRSPSTR